MKRSLRNAALRDAIYVLQGTYHGTPWYSDSHIAIDVDILDGYKLKKDQDYRGNMPDIAPIVDDIPGGWEHIRKTSKGVSADVWQYPVTNFASRNGILQAQIQTKYVDLILDIYPEAHFEASIEEINKPIKIMVGDELHGLIMPLRS